VLPTFDERVKTMKTILVIVRGEAVDMVRTRSVDKAIEKLAKRYPRARFEVCADSSLKEEID
jgi:hypothetical protein